MMPLLMTTMMNVVPAHSRGRMMGRVGLVISLAPAIGPTMSGIVLDSLGWRWLFAIVLPIALIALGLGAKWMTNLGESTHAPIDYVSVVLSVFAFGGIVFGLSQFGGGHGGDAGGSSSTGFAWTAIAAGLVFLALFAWRQLVLQKEDRALLDLRVFSAKNYVIAVIIMAVVSLAMFGTFSLLPLYLQNVAGLNATQSGLVLLPGSILMGVLAPVMGRIYDARGPKDSPGPRIGHDRRIDVLLLHGRHRHAHVGPRRHPDRHVTGTGRVVHTSVLRLAGFTGAQAVLTWFCGAQHHAAGGRSGWNRASHLHLLLCPAFG